MVEELSAVHETQDEIQLRLRLEGELERDDKRVVHLGEYESLCQGMCDFITGSDVSLSKGLQGVDTIRVLLSDLHDFAKRPFPDYFEEFEVVDFEGYVLVTLVYMICKVIVVEVGLTE